MLESRGDSCRISIAGVGNDWSPERGIFILVCELLLSLAFPRMMGEAFRFANAAGRRLMFPLTGP